MGKQSEQVMKKYLLPVMFILLLIFPSDASAEAKTKAQVLSYLTSLPSQSSKKVLSGQFIGWCGEIDSGLFDRIHSISGKYPGLMSANYTPWHGCGSAEFINGANSMLKTHWAAGGLVDVSWHPFNPATGNWGNEVCNLVDLVTNGTGTNTNWKAMLDVVAAGLQDLKDSGVVVIFRPFVELNSVGWLWFSGKDAKQFQNMWIYTYNYLTTTKGLTNLIWAFSTNPYWGSGTEYYPGSSYVDIVGLDYYPYGWDGNWDRFPYLHEYADLSALGKPFALMELGQCPGDSTGCAAKDSTYVITDIKNNFPNTVWWSNWNAHWALDQQYNLSTLLSDPLVITRDDKPSGATVVSGQSKKPSSPAGILIQ